MIDNTGDLMKESKSKSQSGDDVARAMLAELDGMTADEIMAGADDVDQAGNPPHLNAI